MKKSTMFSIAIAAAGVLLATGVANDARAEQIGRKGYSKSPQTGKTVTIQAQFSGSLDREVRIGDHKVVIDKKTALHSSTDGTVDRGFRVVRRQVYVTGTVQADGSVRAQMVIVRDGKDTGKGQVGELPENAAH